MSALGVRLFNWVSTQCQPLYRWDTFQPLVFMMHSLWVRYRVIQPFWGASGKRRYIPYRSAFSRVWKALQPNPDDSAYCGRGTVARLGQFISDRQGLSAEGLQYLMSSFFTVFCSWGLHLFCFSKSGFREGRELLKWAMVEPASEKSDTYVEDPPHIFYFSINFNGRFR